MPLYPNGLALIRANLEAIQRGQRVHAVAIGTLTADQLAGINSSRATEPNPLPPVIDEVLFIGLHVYKSRVIRDGYSIEEVIEQIESAMGAASVFIETHTMTAIQNQTERADRYGNRVKDRAIFECTTKHPRPELFSVMPKGDNIKPPKPPQK